MSEPARELTLIDHPEGVWRVPIEVALSCSSSTYVSLINKRRARGDMPEPNCTVFARGKRFFALVDFAGAGRPQLLFALDCWIWEERDAPRPFGVRGAL